MRVKVLFTLFLLLCCTVMVVLAFAFGSRARTLPLIVGLPLVALLMTQMIIDLIPLARQHLGQPLPIRRPDPTEKDLPVGEGAAGTSGTENTRVPFPMTLLWAATLYLGYCYLGYILTVPSVLLLYLKLQTKESWSFSLALSSATGLFVYVIFYLFVGLGARP